MQADDISNAVTDKTSDIIKLRAAVGLLGEKDHGNWWTSMWFTQNASAFLTPVYGDRLAPARYQGVVEAARRVHDDRVGVGQAFHLFRLPEGLERTLHETVLMGSDCELLTGGSSAESAQEVLIELSAETKMANPGPVRVGSPKDLQGHTWISILADHYQAAFASSIQTFPYFSERS